MSCPASDLNAAVVNYGRDSSPASAGSENTACTGNDKALFTVLLVDDEPSVLRATGLALEMRGFHVLTAANGREALDVFDEHGAGVDIIVIDMNMPHMSGVACVERIRQADAGVPAVLVSGEVTPEVVREASAVGILRCMDKPFRFGELVDTLSKALDGNAPRSAAPNSSP